MTAHVRDNLVDRCCLVASLLASFSAQSAVTVFEGDLVGFNAAGGTPAIGVDFDAILAGTDIDGNTFGGVTFSSPDGNSLDVVVGNSTFTPAGFTSVIDANTNRLFPTSGLNVLSPGGSALVPGSNIAEKDSLTLDFSNPVSAFGVDLLFQSLDFGENVRYSIFDSGLNTIISNAPVDTGSTAAAGAPGDNFFMGFVSDDVSTHISRITFTETDGNATNPDSNIGYDTLRIHSSHYHRPHGCSLLVWSVYGALENPQREPNRLLE